MQNIKKLPFKNYFQNRQHSKGNFVKYYIFLKTKKKKNHTPDCPEAFFHQSFILTKLKPFLLISFSCFIFVQIYIIYIVYINSEKVCYNFLKSSVNK